MRTYIVRVHEPIAVGEDVDRLRGVVDEVRTGRQATFTSAAQLVRLLADVPREIDEPSSTRDEDAVGWQRPMPP